MEPENKYFEGDDELREEDFENEAADEDTDWLALAADAYRSSTDYYNSSLRKQFERNLDMFNNRHPAGSKYHSEGYKYRSKIFRPKTRSAITRNEAQAASSFFATQDIVNVEAEDKSNPVEVAQADVNAQLLNYRLEHDIPWFLTFMGAFQDSMVVGACVSKQYWEYEEKKSEEDLEDPFSEPEMGEDGGMLSAGSAEVEVVADRPVVDLLPIENVRFDPAADWRDPVNTSPYWIHMIPMYLCDVKEKMESDDPKTGRPKWKKASDDILIGSNGQMEHDSTRQRRQKGRKDPINQDGRVSDFRIVWIHENYIRKGGKDYVFYTIGDRHLLSDPVPVEDVYFTGKRPFVFGTTIIEAHKVMPSGAPEIWEGIQTEINEIANQRIDNVKLVLNTRYFVNRSANLDTNSLTHSIPGGVVMMDDVNTDIRPDRPGDVTGSSYQEQDRLNIDFDEIAGAFSPGSVQSNRQLNETVGGMEMLSADSNALTEYRLRIFSETWVQPVLKQLLLLEQAYETDRRILQIAGRKSEAFRRLPVKELRDWMLESPVHPRVNVGFGNSQPQQRIQKIQSGFNIVAEIQQMPGLNMQEIRKEIFGALGYKDGDRFFDDEAAQDPEKQQMMEAIEQLKQQLATKEMETQAKIQVAQINAQAMVESTQIKTNASQEIEGFKARIKETDQKLAAAKLKATNDTDVAKLMMQREALIAQMRQKEADLARNNANSMAETIARGQYGAAPGVDDQPGKG
jgi:hypothetical protein